MVLTRDTDLVRKVRFSRATGFKVNLAAGVRLVLCASRAALDGRANDRTRDGTRLEEMLLLHKKKEDCGSEHRSLSTPENTKCPNAKITRTLKRKSTQNIFSESLRVLILAMGPNDFFVS